MFHRSFEYIVISTIMQETIVSNDLISVRYSFSPGLELKTNA